MLLRFGTQATGGGMSMGVEKAGAMPRNEVVRSAKKLEEEGCVVDEALANDVKTYGSEVILIHENSKAIFGKDGAQQKKGDMLVQKNLAKHT
ncbi:gamma-glutamyltransferase [Salmonella enterica]|uniref:gamma-glutamyltransferase n=1 Tax=Salmonella enterica TaxID=28901 RepID=UPI00398C3B7C